MHTPVIKSLTYLIFGGIVLAATSPDVAANECMHYLHTEVCSTMNTHLTAFSSSAETMVASQSAGNMGTDTTNLNVTSDTTKTEIKNRPFKEKIKRTGSWLKRFIKEFDNYDTSYIEPNYYNYTAMVQNTNFYQFYRIKGTDKEGVSQTLQANPQPGFKAGPYFGWRWIFLGYTFDIGHPGTATKSTEFNLSLYSSMIGCDVVYIRNTDDFTLRKVSGFSEDIMHSVRKQKFSGMKTYTLSIGAYYIFNHRHFSYPAAYSQSTVQRKSCGSVVLGFNYSHQSIDFDYTRLPRPLIEPDEETGHTPLIDELKVSDINYRNCSINAGYAYNWVFARNWLLSLSLTPSIGFKWSKGERFRGETIWKNAKNMKFDFISRAGLVWNNSHYFAGASLITHVYDYQKNKYSLSNYVNYLNIYVGLFFNKKRQYRSK